MKERIELQCHTAVAVGVSRPESLVARAKELNMKGLAIADDASVLSYPELSDRVRHSDFKAIYGVTLPIWCGGCKMDAKACDYATLLAKNKEGIKAIYKLLEKTLSDGKMLLLDDIIRYKENLIVGSSENLFSEQDYLTVAWYQSPETVKTKIKEGEDFSLPVVAVGDVTYSGPDDALLKDVLSKLGFPVLERPLLSTEEMLKKFHYLPKEKAEEIVITNSNLIADKVENNIEPILREFGYEESGEHFKKLKAVAYKKLKELYDDNPPKEALKRAETELELVAASHNITQFYIAYKLCGFAHKKGYPTGLRGTAANSFAAYLFGISEINPLKYNLPYEAFFGFSADKLALIDINFPDRIKPEIEAYLRELYGEKSVIRAGAVGFGVPYKKAAMMAEEYLAKKKKGWSLEELECIENLLSASGIKWFNENHSFGYMLIPRDCSVYDFTPVEEKDGSISSYFDFHSLVNAGVLKINLLGLKSLDFLEALSRETGIDIKGIPLEDKKALELFDNLKTAGITEFSTPFTKMVMRICRVKCFDDLVKISSLSHGSGVWYDNAEALIVRGVIELKDVMANREDIFDFLLGKGVDRVTAFKAMEIVRKGAAAKNSEAKSFIYRLDIQYNLPIWWIKSVCKINYMFSRAHSVSYVLTAIRLAYFKTHYPSAFYKAALQVYGDNKELTDEIRLELFGKGEEKTTIKQ